MTVLTRLPMASSDARFAPCLQDAGLFPLRAVEVTTLQVNVGKRCNQACKHCHVDAGPNRTEEMTEETALLCLDALKGYPSIHTLDITGGAPELNPHFRLLAAGARKLGRHVIDRCNLTILFEPGQEDLADFLAENRVEVTASLPYYLSERTDAQRGTGVFEKSIAGLRRLNDLGYGTDDGLRLNLVYNPTGAFLPPDQGSIEAEYKRELFARHGIVFNSLYTITNLPISRFRHFLERTGNYRRYMDRLHAAFNPAAAANVMCRSLVSVGYDGTLYDCDFNQMLDLPLGSADAVPRHIRDFDAYLLARREIMTGDHCFGCTAGAGSSCGGAVT
ncbi:MAG: arsenosugar biosynthesis radical SAM (seleno)protein ArsS [Armatimonadota bacterium]